MTSPNRTLGPSRNLRPGRIISLSNEISLDIAIDNLVAKVTGDWTVSNGKPGYFGSDYIYTQTTSSGGKSIRWTPKIGKAGEYSVFAILPDGTNARDKSCKYDIYHADGKSSSAIDQRNRGGKWVYLGTYRFSVGRGQYVELTNEKSTSVTINADAVRFLYEGPKVYAGSLNITATAISGGSVKLQISDSAPDWMPYWIERKGASEDAPRGFLIPSGTAQLIDTFSLTTSSQSYTYSIRKLGYKDVASTSTVTKPAGITYSAELLVPAAGYKPNSTKKFIAKSTSGAANFSVVDVVSGSTVLATQSFTAFTDPITGSVLIGDLSSITTPGYYRIRTDNNLNSTMFRIGDDLYDELSRITIKQLSHTRWPQVNMRPREDTGQLMDIGGGWEDAWDYKHWTSYTDTIQPFVLLEMVMNGMNVPGLEDELRWGLDYLLKIQERSPSGLGVMQFGQIIAAYSEDDSTDSDPFIVRVEDVNNTFDMGGYNKRCEHVIAHYLYALVLTKAAKYYKTKDSVYAGQCKMQAIDAYNYINQYDEMTHVKYAESLTTKEFFRALPIINYCYKVLASEELYGLTGETSYRNTAKAYLNRIIKCQKKDFKWNSTKITGLFLKEEGSATLFRNRIHAGIPLYVLATMSRQIGDATDSEWFSWHSAMRIFTDCFVKKFVTTNAYGILPYGFDIGPRKLNAADTMTYRYFQGTETAIGTAYSDGNSKMLALYAAALFQTAITTGDTQLEEIAHRQLEWVCGKNHFATPAVNGFGDIKIDGTKLATHGTEADSFEAIGAVVNGIDGAQNNDSPQWGNNWQTGETWGVNRSWLQLAIASLKKLDQAKLVAKTGGTVQSMSASAESVASGASFTVTAVIKNNGALNATYQIKVFTDNSTNNSATNSVTVNAGQTASVTLNLTAGTADRPYVVAVVVDGKRVEAGSIVGYVT